MIRRRASSGIHRSRAQEYLQALERLAAGALARGEHADAESWLRRVVVVDPPRESARRAPGTRAKRGWEVLAAFGLL